MVLKILKIYDKKFNYLLYIFIAVLPLLATPLFHQPFFPYMDFNQNCISLFCMRKFHIALMTWKWKLLPWCKVRCNHGFIVHRQVVDKSARSIVETKFSIFLATSHRRIIQASFYPGAFISLWCDESTRYFNHCYGNQSTLCDVSG